MMSITTSMKLGALTQKFLLLSVTEKAVCQFGLTTPVRQFHSIVRTPSTAVVCRSQKPPERMTSLIFIPKMEYSTSFFVKHTAEQLWKGVTSVSNAGKKRGRGKGVGKKSAKNLNRGQVIGVGKVNMVWPGLNAPVVQGKELVERRQLPPDEDRQARLLKMRDTMGQFRPLLLSPLERGWSGTKMHGRSIGPPDPIGEDTFEGFDTKVLEMKTVTNMDANYGRVRRFSVFAFTGNKNGLAGFALAKSPDGRGALKRARNRAGQKLLYIQRYEDHTVLHDFFSCFGATDIYVFKKPEGFGLVCHRAIKAICELIGIKNLYVKVKGSTNVQHICKAFMLGLIKQKSHEQIANEKGLYIVEQREDLQNFPTVIAKPNECRTESQISHDETLNFSHYCFGDRIPNKKSPFVPFYVRMHTPGWENHLKKTEWKRNFPQVSRHLAHEYGTDGIFRKSHLSEKYPEADSTYGLQLMFKKMAEEAAQEEE